MQAKEAGLDIVQFPPVWLIGVADTEKILFDIQSCDYLFAQRLADDFSRPELATSRLKDQFGGKIVSWPNAYFDGYFPGLSYRYHPHGRILGPLDEYHWDPIETGFNSGKTVAECVEILSSEAIFDIFPDPVGHSLQQLARRETGLDVTISDYISWRLHIERLFYSMNHPVNLMLRELLDRLFAEIGERNRLSSLTEYGFPLNKIILPILQPIVRRYGIAFRNNEAIKGVRVEFGESDYHVTSDPKEYEMTELVDCFYRTYDLNRVIYGQQ